MIKYIHDSNINLLHTQCSLWELISIYPLPIRAAWQWWVSFQSRMLCHTMRSSIRGLVDTAWKISELLSHSHCPFHTYTLSTCCDLYASGVHWKLSARWDVIMASFGAPLIDWCTQLSVQVFFSLVLHRTAAQPRTFSITCRMQFEHRGKVWDRIYTQYIDLRKCMC